MNITNIESLTYEEAKALAVETMRIKDHDCIFAELGESFGYSVLVFKDGMYIYYANDYELHHNWLVKEKGKEALRDFYIKEMQNKLYTDEELLQDIKSYDEYDKKQHFLKNYWIMKYDYLSAFAIGRENQEKVEKGKKSYPFFNPISFCYVKDKNIIEIQTKYLKHIEREFKKLKSSNDTFREMIRYELANHEACITCDYTEALNALGMEYGRLTDEQRKIVKEELKKQIDSYNN